MGYEIDFNDDGSVRIKITNPRLDLDQVIHPDKTVEVQSFVVRDRKEAREWRQKKAAGKPSSDCRAGNCDQKRGLRRHVICRGCGSEKCSVPQMPKEQAVATLGYRKFKCSEGRF